MKQIKIMESNVFDRLERDVNMFIADKQCRNVIDIQYRTTSAAVVDVLYSVMIVYEDLF